MTTMDAMNIPVPPEEPRKPRKEAKCIQTWLPHRVWQYRELIRHHTIRALLRRIPKHVRRIISEHHFRDYTYR